jgi:hypothetical protein
MEKTVFVMPVIIFLMISENFVLTVKACNDTVCTGFKCQFLFHDASFSACLVTGNSQIVCDQSGADKYDEFA